MRPRWPLPIGATRSMIRVVRLLGLGLEPQPLLRVQRRQLAELDAVAGRLGLDAVDGVEPHERVVLLAALLALARLPDGAGDGVALAQAVLAHLGERDVDVVGARAGSRWCARRRSCRGCRGCRRPARRTSSSVTSGSRLEAVAAGAGAVPRVVADRGRGPGGGCGGRAPRRRRRSRCGPGCPAVAALCCRPAPRLLVAAGGRSALAVVPAADGLLAGRSAAVDRSGGRPRSLAAPALRPAALGRRVPDASSRSSRRSGRLAASAVAGSVRGRARASLARSRAGRSRRGALALGPGPAEPLRGRRRWRARLIAAIRSALRMPEAPGCRAGRRAT